MASVVFYFQVHQPHRLKRFTVFDDHPFYFDDEHDGRICQKVAEKCYRPATSLMLDLVRRHEGNFRVSFSITLTAIDQLKRHAPDVIDLFAQLAATGCCEFLAETSHHSLSFLYSQNEFQRQVDLHTAEMVELFGQTPAVFRDTELIYCNELAQAVSRISAADGTPRFAGTLAEGVDRILGYRSPNYLYRPPGELAGRGGRPFGLLLKNYRLSDDIAFRFSNRSWNEWPLTAEKFARWIDGINGDGYICNLFMDYETFGEHQWAETGIFHFIEDLPQRLFDINPGENHFITPSMAFSEFDSVGIYDAPSWTSWADTERDLSAWLGNAMQHNAIKELYGLERPILEQLAAAERTRDPQRLERARHLLNDWRKLSTSDHYYYMSTKHWADGEVHEYFSPYESPYDGYINFMNVLEHLRRRVEEEPA